MRGLVLTQLAENGVCGKRDNRGWGVWELESGSIAKKFAEGEYVRDKEEEYKEEEESNRARMIHFTQQATIEVVEI